MEVVVIWEYPKVTLAFGYMFDEVNASFKCPYLGYNMFDEVNASFKRPYLGP